MQAIAINQFGKILNLRFGLTTRLVAVALVMLFLVGINKSMTLSPNSYCYPLSIKIDQVL